MDKQRVWGVRCPDGTIRVSRSERRAFAVAACRDSGGILGAHLRCHHDHVVVYADIEWKEERT